MINIPVGYRDNNLTHVVFMVALKNNFGKKSSEFEKSFQQFTEQIKPFRSCMKDYVARKTMEEFGIFDNEGKSVFYEFHTNGDNPEVKPLQQIISIICDKREDLDLTLLQYEFFLLRIFGEFGHKICTPLEDIMNYCEACQCLYWGYKENNNGDSMDWLYCPECMDWMREEELHIMYDNVY